MHLHVVDNLSFYLLNGIVTKRAAKALLDGKDAAIKSFLPFLNAAVEGMGNLELPQVFAPIARDYVKFNA